MLLAERAKNGIRKNSFRHASGVKIEIYLILNPEGIYICVALYNIGNILKAEFIVGQWTDSNCELICAQGNGCIAEPTYVDNGAGIGTGGIMGIHPLNGVFIRRNKFNIFFLGA